MNKDAVNYRLYPDVDFRGMVKWHHACFGSMSPGSDSRCPDLQFRAEIYIIAV